MEVFISGALPDEKMEYCSASPGIDLGAESAEGSAEEQLYYRQEPAHSLAPNSRFTVL